MHRVLMTGIAAAAVFLCGGLCVSIARQQALPRATVKAGSLLQGLLKLDPGAIVTVGIAILVLTPVVRVIGSILAFARVRELGFVALTALVLALMTAGFLLGVG